MEGGIFYWVSSNRITILVEVGIDNLIRDAPPIARKFIGQRFENLIKWMAKQGGLRVVKLKD